MTDKLAIFDFDGTLFRSPEKPVWWEGGWWGNLKSLSDPCVPDRPSSDWWNQTVVSAAKQSINNPDVLTVMLTGRIPKFSLRVKDLLQQAGLRFDEVRFSSGGPTEKFKIGVMDELLKKHTSIRGVSIWEDRGEHLRVFADWVESNGRACFPHLITVSAHELGCPPPTKEASASRVAAKFKSKKKDDKGNVHYEYSDRQVQHRHREKAKRIEKLRKGITDLRKRVEKDISSEDPAVSLPALAVSLIDETCERVGNDDSAKEGHFGVTGWQVGHVSFSKGKATLEYVGKSGVKHEKVVTKAPVVKLLKSLTKGRGKKERLLELDGEVADPNLVNSYLEEFDITAKDIRGFRANQEMCKALREIRRRGEDLPHSRKDRDKILKAEFKEALEEVADIVGHEQATLRSDYLVPGLEDSYMKDGTILSSFKSATKSDSEKENEAAEELVKPSPKKKPPRTDLKKRRVDHEDEDISTHDDDLSLNYKDSSARIAMAVRVASVVLVADRYAKSKKIKDTFLETVKGKKFTNPDSGKSVVFKSLPLEEQAKLRAKHDKEQEEAAKKAPSGETPVEAPEAPTKKAPTKKAPTKKAPKKAPEGVFQEKGDEVEEGPESEGDDDEAETSQPGKPEAPPDPEYLEAESRRKLREDAKHIEDSLAFDADTATFVGDTLDNLFETMSKTEATEFVGTAIKARDSGITSLANGGGVGKPPDSQQISKLRSRYNGLRNKLTRAEKEMDHPSTNEDRKKQLDSEIRVHKQDLETTKASLKKDFAKFYTHAALAKAIKNPLTGVDTSTPMDKGKTKTRVKDKVRKYKNMGPEDRAGARQEFQRLSRETKNQIEELESDLSSADSESDAERPAKMGKLNKLKNQAEYLDTDSRALEITAALLGEDTDDSPIPQGTRGLIKALKDSGMDHIDMVNAGLGLGPEGEALNKEDVSNLVKRIHPKHFESLLQKKDPSGNMAKSWAKTIGTKDEANAHRFMIEMLTDDAVEDVIGLAGTDDKEEMPPEEDTPKKDPKKGPYREDEDEESEAYVPQKSMEDIVKLDTPKAQPYQSRMAFFHRT